MNWNRSLSNSAPLDLVLPLGKSLSMDLKRLTVDAFSDSLQRKRVLGVNGNAYRGTGAHGKDLKGTKSSRTQM